MTATYEKAMQKAKKLISKLDFEGCISLYNQLESGHPMIDLVFDRMELLDSDRFNHFLEN
jgi:hypothetical protein